MHTTMQFYSLMGPTIIRILTIREFFSRSRTYCNNTVWDLHLKEKKYLHVTLNTMLSSLSTGRVIVGAANDLQR